MNISAHARCGPNALNMKRVKLFAAPLIISIARQAIHLSLFQRPLLIVQSLPSPFFVDYRITESSLVRRTYLFAVKETRVCVVVTGGASKECCLGRIKIRSLMLCVTRDTTYAGRLMWFDYCRSKGLGVVTGGALGFHASC